MSDLWQIVKVLDCRPVSMFEPYLLLQRVTNVLSYQLHMDVSW